MKKTTVARWDNGRLNYDKYEGHTPGPWVQSNMDSMVIVIGDDYQPIATTMEHWSNDKEESANANLIAAAPDLLERCKRLEAALESALVDIEDFVDALWDGNTEGWSATAKAIRRALA